jgi:hypothetical protein
MHHSKKLQIHHAPRFALLVSSLLATVLVMTLAMRTAAAFPTAPDEPGVQLRVNPGLTESTGVRLIRGVEPDRSESTAITLSVGSTLGGIAAGITLMAASGGNGGTIATGITLAALGLGVGPSLGHFYAGEVGRGLLMSLGRLVSGGASFGFFVGYVLSGIGGGDGTAGMGVASIGFGLLTVTLAVIDLIDAPAAVRRRLARRRAASGLASLTVAPLVAQTPASGDV